MMDEQETCKNCNAPMQGDFCAHCGQKRALPLDSKRLFHDIWGHFIDFDFALARSFRDLILSPGKLIHDYIEGKRKRYTNPFKLLFICATIYFLAISFFDVKVDFISQNQVNEENARHVVALLNYLVFLFLLPTAWFYKFIFRKQQLSFAAAYVSVSYIWALYLLVAAVLAPLSVWVSELYGLIRTTTGFIVVLLSVKHLYKMSFFQSVLSTLLFYVGYFVSTILIMSVVIAISYWIHFEPLMFKLTPP